LPILSKSVRAEASLSQSTHRMAQYLAVDISITPPTIPRDSEFTFHEVLPGSCPRIAISTRFCQRPPFLREHRQLVNGILSSLATVSSLRVAPRCERTRSTGNLNAEGVASAAQLNGSLLEVHEESLSELRRISELVVHTYLQ
jgi:hypothetical protein